MNLARLLVVHAIVTLAAGVVLIVAPGVIPAAVGVQVPSSAYLVCYLLGTAEIAIAALSFGAARLNDPQALRLVSTVFIVFHTSTAVVEAYAFTSGVDAAVWGNVAIRVIVSALFAYYGIYKNPFRTVRRPTQPVESE